MLERTTQPMTDAGERPMTLIEKLESKAKAAYEWLDAGMQKMVSKN